MNKKFRKNKYKYIFISCLVSFMIITMCIGTLNIPNVFANENIEQTMINNKGNELLDNQKKEGLEDSSEDLNNGSKDLNNGSEVPIEKNLNDNGNIEKKDYVEEQSVSDKKLESTKNQVLNNKKVELKSNESTELKEEDSTLKLITPFANNRPNVKAKPDIKTQVDVSEQNSDGTYDSQLDLKAKKWDSI